MCSDAHFFSTYDVCAHVECRLYNVTAVCVCRDDIICVRVSV